MVKQHKNLYEMGRLTMKKKMFICFVLAALILVCVADYSQQKEYKKINSDKEYVEKGFGK